MTKMAQVNPLMIGGMSLLDDYDYEVEMVIVVKIENCTEEQARKWAPLSHNYWDDWEFKEIKEVRRVSE